MAMDETWTTDSGFFTDYEGTVTDAYFGPWDRATDPNATFLFLKFETDSPDRPEHTEILGLGGDWTSNDGGETVESQTKKKFSDFSAYGKWIKRVVSIGAGEEVGEKGPTTAAKTWLGTKWRVESHQEKAYTARSGPNAGQLVTPRPQNLPTALLEASEGNLGGGANGQVAAQADLSFLDEATREELATMARQSASKDGWLDRVMVDKPEVRTTEGLVGKLAGAGVYETLKNG